MLGQRSAGRRRRGHDLQPSADLQSWSHLCPTEIPSALSTADLRTLSTGSQIKPRVCAEGVVSHRSMGLPVGSVADGGRWGNEGMVVGKRGECIIA